MSKEKSSKKGVVITAKYERDSKPNKSGKSQFRVYNIDREDEGNKGFTGSIYVPMKLTEIPDNLTIKLDGDPQLDSDDDAEDED